MKRNRNAGNLCFDTWCQVFVRMISSAAVFSSYTRYAIGRLHNRRPCGTYLPLPLSLVVVHLRNPR